MDARRRGQSTGFNGHESVRVSGWVSQAWDDHRYRRMGRQVMSDSAVSPDGRWRWEHERWVPTEGNSPPPLQQLPYQASSPANSSARNGGVHPLTIPALVAGLISLAIIIIQIGADTIQAFGDGYPGTPWFYSFWFELIQALISVAAVTLAALCLRSAATRATALIFAIASAVAFQSLIVIFYRVVVSHFGYGTSL
jgi:hypothetical protein